MEDLNRPILHVNFNLYVVILIETFVKLGDGTTDQLTFNIKTCVFLKKGSEKIQLSDAVTSGVKCESNSDMKTFCYSLNSMMLAKYDKIGDMQLKISRLLNK